jgi:CBS domain-containing protein
MLVRDCMSPDPIVIHAQDDYKRAFEVMEHHTLRHLPVLDDHEHLVGILAERDLLLAATHYLQCAVEVAEVMHRDVVTVTPDMPLDEAALLMASHHIGGLPVVNGDHTVVGILTESDIFHAIARHTH